MHLSILLVSLLGMVFIAAVFAFVVLNSGPRDEDYGGISKRGYVIRRWRIIGLSCTAKHVNVRTISLDQAPEGYAEFDGGAAKKFVVDPHGMIA